MPLVQIGSTVLKLTDFNDLPDEVGGKKQRTLSGSLRGDILWVARQWSGTAVITTSTADYMALRALADGKTSRTCTGDAFPGSSTACIVECGQVTYVHKPGAWYYSVALTFKQVQGT